MQRLKKIIIFSLLVSFSLLESRASWSEISNQERGRKEPASREKSWIALGPGYSLDLNSDGREELIRFTKKDGDDLVSLMNEGGELLWSKTFQATGLQSRFSKMRLIDIGENKRSLLLFFYEGYTQASDFYAEGRVYALSFERSNLRRIQFQSLFPYWIESQTPSGANRRLYSLDVRDLDENGTKDLILHHGPLMKIWALTDELLWKKF